MTYAAYAAYGTLLPGVLLLALVPWPRDGITVGPSWIGRAVARGMLDIFLPDRDRYISAAIPRYPMLPGPSAAEASAMEAEVARQYATAAGNGWDQAPFGELNAYLHAHPEVMAAWLAGWHQPPVVPGPGGLVR